ncbi:MAG: hypothetical protein I4O49_00915 [Janthinobacterium lividum]|nr:hypothetical protein [Janthinobacterium lividum]
MGAQDGAQYRAQAAWTRALAELNGRRRLRLLLAALSELERQNQAHGNNRCRLRMLQ